MTPTTDAPIVYPDVSPNRGDGFDSGPLWELIKEFKGDTPRPKICEAAGLHRDFLYRFTNPTARHEVKRFPEESIPLVAHALGCPEWRVWEAFAKGLGRPWGAPHDYPGVTDLANRYKHLHELSAAHPRALLLFSDVAPRLTTEQIARVPELLRKIAALTDAHDLDLLIATLDDPDDAELLRTTLRGMQVRRDRIARG